MVSFTPLVTLFLRKGQWYPINKRVGRPQSASGFSGALAPAGNRTPNPPQPSHNNTSAVMDLQMYIKVCYLLNH